ncbi:MAG: hypothetical protein IT459_23555 [Planctomycetes bacterium]|nr:hypothetical protein [Planctomycetota bacterium]
MHRKHNRKTRPASLDDVSPELRRQIRAFGENQRLTRFLAAIPMDLARRRPTDLLPDDVAFLVVDAVRLRLLWKFHPRGTQLDQTLNAVCAHAAIETVSRVHPWLLLAIVDPAANMLAARELDRHLYEMFRRWRGEIGSLMSRDAPGGDQFAERRARAVVAEWLKLAPQGFLPDPLVALLDAHALEQQADAGGSTSATRLPPPSDGAAALWTAIHDPRHGRGLIMIGHDGRLRVGKRQLKRALVSRSKKHGERPFSEFADPDDDGASNEPTLPMSGDEFTGAEADAMIHSLDTVDAARAARQVIQARRALDRLSASRRAVLDHFEDLARGTMSLAELAGKVGFHKATLGDAFKREQKAVAEELSRRRVGFS